MCFSSSSHKKIADQERRARRGPEHRCSVCLMSLICFRCLRFRSHVSESREFQDTSSLAEGSHVLDSTLAIAEDEIEPPAIMCRHKPRSTRGSIASWCSIEAFAACCIRFEQQRLSKLEISFTSFRGSAESFWSRSMYCKSDSSLLQNYAISFGRLVDRIFIRVS